VAAGIIRLPTEPESASEQVATNAEDANGCDSFYERESESASEKQGESALGEEQRVQENGRGPKTGEELEPAREDEAEQELLNERS
jgi:hypothetical protein